MEKKKGLSKRMGNKVGNGLAEALETALSIVYKEPNTHFYIMMKCRNLQTRNSRNGSHCYWCNSLLFNMLNIAPWLQEAGIYDLYFLVGETQANNC